ncbi:MAG: DNA polymerase IV [Planctomycetota bacterium]
MPREARARAPAPKSILHVDMDAFFASVEARDDPSLAGKPVVVGGPPEGHGVVAAASYEARAHGIRSAMPMATALRLCPDVVRVPARHGRYAEVSREVFKVLERYTPLVEPVSIDEAYLDVTGSGRLFGDAREIALAVKRSIREELGLTCSVGVAATKLVAKVASDLQKPDGLTVVEPGGEAAFLAPLPVEKLPGVGPKTAELLHEMGVRTLGRLARSSPDALEGALGSHGPDLVARARGEDASPVVGAGEGEAAKQISSETTLGEFTDDVDEVDRILLALAEEVARRARDGGLEGRTITLKLRDDRFHTRTRAETLSAPTDIALEIAGVARALYRTRPVGRGRKVRLLGVALSKLARAGLGQAELFTDESRERARRAERAMDEIREALGSDSVKRGRLLRKDKGGSDDSDEEPAD